MISFMTKAIFNNRVYSAGHENYGQYAGGESKPRIDLIEPIRGSRSGRPYDGD
jgi:hypothetical protein